MYRLQVQTTIHVVEELLDAVRRLGSSGVPGDALSLGLGVGFLSSEEDFHLDFASL